MWVELRKWLAWARLPLTILCQMGSRALSRRSGRRPSVSLGAARLSSGKMVSAFRYDLGGCRKLAKLMSLCLICVFLGIWRLLADENLGDGLSLPVQRP